MSLWHVPQGQPRPLEIFLIFGQSITIIDKPSEEEAEHMQANNSHPAGLGDTGNSRSADGAAGVCAGALAKLLITRRERLTEWMEQMRTDQRG